MADMAEEEEDFDEFGRDDVAGAVNGEMTLTDAWSGVPMLNEYNNEDVYGHRVMYYTSPPKHHRTWLVLQTVVLFTLRSSEAELLTRDKDANRHSVVVRDGMLIERVSNTEFEHRVRQHARCNLVRRLGTVQKLTNPGSARFRLPPLTEELYEIALQQLTPVQRQHAVRVPKDEEDTDDEEEADEEEA